MNLRHFYVSLSLNCRRSLHHFLWLQRFRSRELVEQDGGFGRVPQYPLLNEDILGALVDVLVDTADILPHDWLDWLILCRPLQQVRSQSIDHDFEMQGLIVEFLVQFPIVFVRNFLLCVDLLEAFKFRLLALSVLL